MKRGLMIVLIVGAAGGAYFYSAWRRPHNLVLTGIVTTDEVAVSSQIAGRMTELKVKEGDLVKRDELLALIDPQELRATRDYYAHNEEGAGAQVKEAEANLRFQELQTNDQIRQAKETLAAAEAQEEEAAADRENARLNSVRTEKLFGQGIASAQANDQARTTFEAAQAHDQGLRKQVDAQRAALALAEANAEQVAARRSQLVSNQHQLAAAGAQKDTADVRLAYTEIRAPIAGLVSQRAALEGEVVIAGQPIVTLVNPDDFWVRADVEETYIDRIRLGDHMSVRFPSGLEREGTVFYRGVDADFATQRDVSRTKRDIKTFEIRLRVDNSDRRLYPGLTAFVTVPLKAE